ncbi:hypothetical protein Acsp05_63620 [Actinokineospora sp. NBRC 105648]|nr:hypothetical protein Acsp05_63620 [Actinokineospora sp. NBRC 105648]
MTDGSDTTDQGWSEEARICVCLSTAARAIDFYFQCYQEEATDRTPPRSFEHLLGRFLTALGLKLVERAWERSVPETGSRS